MERRRAPGEDNEPLLTYPILLVVLAAFTGISGFQVLLPVVPLYAESVGGGSAGAGLATAVFMLTTVLAQTQMPRTLGRVSYRVALAVGMLLLGPPAFAYVLTQELASILAVTLVRGVGFGIVTVVFAALISELAPSGRRGEALGLLGVALTLPAIFGNAFGLWLVESSGYAAVFALGGAVPLLGFLAALGIRHEAASVRHESGAGFLSGLGRGELMRMFIIFSTMTVAYGVVVTFLPLAVSSSGIFSAAAALLVAGVAITLGRLWAGRFGDRHDARWLIVPALVSAALGMVALSGSGPVLLVGALLVGAGFGILQNATLVLIMSRVSSSEYGLGSTMWNIAFDGGTGLGAFLFGFIIGASGFSTAFYLCAVLLAAVTVLVPLDLRAQKKTVQSKG